MVVVLTIKKMSYWVAGIFDDKFFDCAVCINLAIEHKKGPCLFHKSYNLFQ